MLWNQNSKKSSWWDWQVLWCCGIVLTVVPVTWDNRYLGLGSQHQSHPASPSNQHRAHIQSALQSSYCSWLAGLLSVAPQQRRLPGMTSAATAEDVSEILKSVLVPQSPPNRCDQINKCGRRQIPSGSVVKLVQALRYSVKNYLWCYVSPMYKFWVLSSSSLGRDISCRSMTNKACVPG